MTVIIAAPAPAPAVPTGDRVPLRDDVLTVYGGLLAVTEGAVVNVYLAGTTTLAPIYAAETGGTTRAQPLTTNGGRIESALAPGEPLWVDSGVPLDIVGTYVDRLGNSVPFGPVREDPLSANVGRRLGSPTTTDYTPVWRQGAGMTVWVPPTGINPHSSEYGAVGNGVADDYAALLAAANRASVLKAHVDLMGDYNIVGGQLVIPDKVVLKGRGPGMTRILQGQWSSTLLRSTGSIGTAVALTADVQPPNANTLALASTAGMAVNDRLLLGSEAAAYGASAAAAGKRGEIVRIRSVDSGTQVTLWGPVRDIYLVADGASVQRFAMNSRPGLEDMAVVNPATPGTHTTSFLEFNCCLEPFLSNVAFEGCESTAAIFRNTYGGDVDGCSFRDQPDHVAGTGVVAPLFGYGIGPTCAAEALTVRGIKGQKLRHLFTTLTAQSVRGIPRNITVQGVARDMVGIPFDTHPAAEEILFHGCVAEGCSHAGYSLRGVNNRVVGSSAAWCAYGAWIAGPAWGSEIRGCSFKHLGGLYTGQGEDAAPSTNGGGHGIAVVGSPDGMPDGLVIEDNTFEHLLRSGMSFSSASGNQPVKRARIRRNDIINPGQIGGVGAYGIEFTSTISDIVDTLVERNLFVAYSASGPERRSGSGLLSDAVRVDALAVTGLRVIDNEIDGHTGAIVGGARANDAGITKRPNRVSGKIVQPSVRAYRSTAQGIVTATLTDVDFDQERWDTDNFHSTPANTFTVPAGCAGRYQCTAHIRWSANATGEREVMLNKNGGTFVARSLHPAAASGLTFQTVTATVELAAGDTMRVTVRHTAGVNINVDPSNTGTTQDAGEFEMVLVSES